MKVRIVATLAGKQEIASPAAEVKTLADLSKLCKRVEVHIAGVKKFMPGAMESEVEKLRFMEVE